MSHSLYHRNTLPDEEIIALLRSTCLVGTTPLRLHPAGTTTSRQEARCSQTDTSQDTSSHRAPLDTDTCPSLDTNISPRHPPLLRTGHSMAKLTPIDTDPIHWPKTPPMSNVSAQRTISFDTYYDSCTPSTRGGRSM